MGKSRDWDQLLPEGTYAVPQAFAAAGGMGGGL